MSKITDLVEKVSSFSLSDFIPMVDVADTTMGASGTTKKLKLLNLVRALAMNVQHIATAETQAASTAYGGLSTTGPVVTVTTGTLVLVLLSCQASRSAAGNSAYMSVAVSGATTIAAADSNAAINQSAGTGTNTLFVAKVLTVTAGSNTFTAKYRNDGGSTWTFQNRTMIVIPLN